MYDPFQGLFGGFSQNDGTVDFYGRVNILADKDKTLLDLGAGRGAWFYDDPLQHRKNIQMMKGKFGKVIAIDPDEAVLKNPTADECLVMSGEQIPLADSSVDVIVSDYVLEHIGDISGLVSEVDRVLKKGGWFCARTPHKYCYVSLFNRLLRPRYHSMILKYAQPSRKEVDVFPAHYKLNTLAAIRSAFSGYEDRSFIYRSDPAYYFNSPVMFKVMQGIHQVSPAWVNGNIFVFLCKK